MSIFYIIIFHFISFFFIISIKNAILSHYQDIFKIYLKICEFIFLMIFYPYKNINFVISNLTNVSSPWTYLLLNMKSHFNFPIFIFFDPINSKWSKLLSSFEKLDIDSFFILFIIWTTIFSSPFCKHIFWSYHFTNNLIIISN
jgi:hypothetical protein